MHSPSRSFHIEPPPAVHILDYSSQRESLHFNSLSGQIPAKFPTADVCIFVDAPPLFEVQHAGRLLTLIIDREATKRELRRGQYQILPALSDDQIAFPNWKELALELLNTSLTGNETRQLELDDLLDVLAETHNQKLHFAMISASQPLREAPLRFQTLYATLFCPPAWTYSNYLEVALIITGKLPKASPLRIGMRHFNERQPLILLLGELITA